MYASAIGLKTIQKLFLPCYCLPQTPAFRLLAAVIASSPNAQDHMVQT